MSCQQVRGRNGLLGFWRFLSLQTLIMFIRDVTSAILFINKVCPFCRDVGVFLSPTQRMGILSFWIVPQIFGKIFFLCRRELLTAKIVGRKSIQSSINTSLFLWIFCKCLIWQQTNIGICLHLFPSSWYIWGDITILCESVAFSG